MIKFANIRIGFACNSSSSHSMVFLSKNSEDHDCSLKSTSAKEAHFLHAFCSEASKQGVDPRMALIAAKELFGLPTDMQPISIAGEQTHSLCFPTTFIGNGAHPRFAMELLDNYIRHKDLSFVYSEADARFNMPFLSAESKDLSARKDPFNGMWTLFNRNNGAKARFALSPGLEISEIDDESPFDSNTRSYYPELVNVKITEYCSGAPCSKHCYQSSGIKGKHARLSDIAMIASILGKAQVF